MAEKKFMVQIESLEKYFGEDRERVHVLKGVSLDIPEGSLYTFLGPSGCGKTTTLRCVAGLERPDGGKISIDGKAVFASGERVYIPTNKRPIGMVFQSYAIWPHMTVFENVAYPLTIQRRPKSEIRKRVEDLVRHLGSYDQFMISLGRSLETSVNQYNKASKEFYKIDKDVLRITGSSNEVEVLEIDQPDREE